MNKLLYFICLFNYGFAFINYINLHKNVWLLNKNNHCNPLFGAYTDITTSNSIQFQYNISSDVYNNYQLNHKLQWKITFSGIPNYIHSIQPEMFSSLLNHLTRNKTNFELYNGSTVKLPCNLDYIRLGSNISYNTKLVDQCKEQYSYLLSNSSCPIAYKGEFTFPLKPRIELNPAGCCTSLSDKPLGYAVNGIPLLGLIANSDQFQQQQYTYKNKHIWHVIIHEYEKYNTDECSGQSTDGIYHHHSYSQCLANRLNDTGYHHSPVYGIASDGYPIYGPWQSSSSSTTTTIGLDDRGIPDKGILIKTCWKQRDYQYITGTGGGCSDNLRSCLLIDPEDPSKGTIVTKFLGPRFDEMIIINSTIDRIIANIGIFLEDYYYDKECSKNDHDHNSSSKLSDNYYLDKHNGHIHLNDSDNIGYHYHFTIDEKLNPVFPFIIGPKYYGCIEGSICISDIINKSNTSTNTLSQCYNPSEKDILTNQPIVIDNKDSNEVNSIDSITSNDIDINDIGDNHEIYVIESQNNDINSNNSSKNTNEDNNSNNDNNDDAVRVSSTIGLVCAIVVGICILIFIFLILHCLYCPKKNIEINVINRTKVIPV